MPEPTAQDYRIALLVAAQRELIRLQHAQTDEDRRRELSRAAIEALASLVPEQRAVGR